MTSSTGIKEPARPRPARGGGAWRHDFKTLTRVRGFLLPQEPPTRLRALKPCPPRGKNCPQPSKAAEGLQGPHDATFTYGHPRKMEGGENRNQPPHCPPMALSQDWMCEVGEPEGPTVPNCPPSLQGLTRGCSQRRRHSNRAGKGTGAGLKTQGKAVPSDPAHYVITVSKPRPHRGAFGDL